MITFEEALSKLKSGKILELKFRLNGGVFSRHELSLKSGVISDESFVDGTTTSCSIQEYRNSLYGKAFILNAVELLEER